VKASQSGRRARPPRLNDENHASVPGEDEAVSMKGTLYLLKRMEGLVGRVPEVPLAAGAVMRQGEDCTFTVDPTRRVMRGCKGETCVP